ncbi:uncharacterized protein LOC107494417 [Arachis duranensis]|uniref:Uncharacterized protein LOC107494417 n=1 Tax=Arachis duranensis TaxID=130453 RepID=A0A9C6TSG8_ARADU|nr:uncharacterized protein LOC107494417 [Arachis duranensis]
MFMNFGYNKSYYFILHSGVDEHLIEKILEPSYLDEWLAHSVASKTYFKNQQPEQKHGLVRQERLTTVATILCLMHLSTASGIWISLECRLFMTPEHTAFVSNPDYYRYQILNFIVEGGPAYYCGLFSF